VGWAGIACIANHNSVTRILHLRLEENTAQTHELVSSYLVMIFIEGLAHWNPEFCCDVQQLSITILFFLHSVKVNSVLLPA
jgi:hypothetical protein